MKKNICKNCGAENSPEATNCFVCHEELGNSNNKDLQVSSPEKRKRTIGVLAGIAFFYIGYAVIQHFFFSGVSFDKGMMAAASEINKTCPIMVDSITRLENVIAMPDNSFQYNYTIVNINRSQVNADTIKKYIMPKIINNVKTNPDMKIYKDHKTTLQYNYSDKNGVFVLKLSITPDMYE